MNASQSLLHMFLRIVLVSALVFLHTSVQGQSTFEDLSGRFVIDIPEGYKPDPQENSVVFKFSGGGGLIVMALYENEKDVEKVFETVLSNVNGALQNVAVETQPALVKINGNAGKWGIFRGTVQSSGTTVTLYACVGAVTLKAGGVTFLTFLNDKTRSLLTEKLRASFGTIRNAGQATR